MRVELDGASPPVWRSLELPGDLTLPRVHDVIQAAMGWDDSHLHRFRTGHSYRSPYFVTYLDLGEGEDGLVEDDVRLDQVVSAKGDRLWYEYDFGDSWDHVLTVEAVLDDPPATPRCTGGEMACPPEDCGGLGGYAELAEWVRSGYDDDLLPEGFEDAEHGHSWLGPDWHPDHFDIEAADAALARASAEPAPVTGEIAELAEQLDMHGVRSLRAVLSRPASHAPAEVTDAEAARLTETYRLFLDMIGDGVTLTGAGYLRPALVLEFAERSGIADWYIGKTNREDQTLPVATVRGTARALGLVTVRKGRLHPTAAGTRCRGNARALWQQIVRRLPLGTDDADRQAGWMVLAVVGSGTPGQDWASETSELMFALGWRSGADRVSPPPAYSPTFDVLQELTGAARNGWRVEGSDDAVAATARAVLRRG